MVGIRGSYDQSMSRMLGVGSRVFVCDNMAFSTEVSIATKQTTNIGSRLPGLMRAAVAQIPHRLRIHM
jgi:glycerol-3-phosphate responsive antiterminator